VDVEEIEGLADPSEVQIRECIARIEELGQRPILYSRRDFISQYPDFGIPTWMAQYDGYPVLEPGDIGKQHSGSVLIEGVEVDLSVFDDAFVLEEEDMALSDQDKQWINEAVDNQLKALQAAMLTNIATNADLRLAVVVKAIVDDDKVAAQILGVTPTDIAKAVADEQARRLKD